MAAGRADLAELEHVSRPRAAQPLDGRALAVEAAVAGAFLAAAAALAALGHGRVRWDVAVVLVVCLAATVRAQYDIGSGYAPPTQLVFVAALLLEPPSVAPVIAVAGWGLGLVPDTLRGELHVSRLLLKTPSNCWFAIGPALVLELAGVHGPSWADWPLYLAALVAQFAGDLLSGVLREWAQVGVPPALQLRSLAYVWAFDAALSPVGLLAAFASVDGRFAFVGVLPLAAILATFSTERARRFGAEVAALRSREAMIAGASHELRTPITVLSGLIQALEYSSGSDAQRRADALASMRRQTGQLRHLVERFIAYAELKAGRPMIVHPIELELGAVLTRAADLWESEVRVAPGTVRAVADPEALHGVLMALISNALKHGPADGPVLVAARDDGGGRVLVEVTDTGPGIAEDRLRTVFNELSDTVEGSGLGLYMARETMRAMGGDLRLGNRAGGDGLVASVYLPGVGVRLQA